MSMRFFTPVENWGRAGTKSDPSLTHGDRDGGASVPGVRCQFSVRRPTQRLSQKRSRTSFINFGSFSFLATFLKAAGNVNRQCTRINANESSAGVGPVELRTNPFALISVHWRLDQSPPCFGLWLQLGRAVFFAAKRRTSVANSLSLSGSQGGA